MDRDPELICPKCNKIIPLLHKKKGVGICIHTKVDFCEEIERLGKKFAKIIWKYLEPFDLNHEEKVFVEKYENITVYKILNSRKNEA